MLDMSLWDKAVAFHGHECPGLAIGFKACEGVIAEFGLDVLKLPTTDEELVCVTENDACGVDAVQALLGCTYGKANLIPRLRGKMAFSFFVRDTGKVRDGKVRDTGKAIRLVLEPDSGKGLNRAEYQDYLLHTPYDKLFDVGKPLYPLPEPARLFDSQACARCGEMTAEYALRIQDGQPVCLDCYDRYAREGF